MVDTLTVQIELPRDLLIALNVPSSGAGRRAQEWLTILDSTPDELMSDIEVARAASPTASP